MQYACPFIPHSGDRVVKNGHHTTGYYTPNAFGKVIPQLMILDSILYYKKHFKIDPQVCIRLPKLVGKFGLDDAYLLTLCRERRLGPLKDIAFSLCVSVSRKGGMVTSLWMKHIEEVILML